VMVLRFRKVALFLGVLGAFGQLVLSFAGLGVGAVALGGLLPVVDLFLRRRLGGIFANGAEAQFALLGGGLHGGAANALGLEEGPQVRGLDVLLMDSVWAPLPSVSDNARHSAITAINSAIFRFSPAASLAWSACSMLSCALMIPSLDNEPHD